MKRWIGWAVAALVVLVLVAAIGRALTARRAEQVSAAAPKAAAVLELGQADIVTASRVPLARVIEVSGSVRAVNSAFVKARVAAEIRSIAVREGDAVKAGQALVQQDTTEYELRMRQAEQQAQAARAQLEIAQRALANNRALVSQGFISPTALDTAVNTEAGAQATLQAALTAVELAKKSRADATLVAPIGGLIAQRLAQPGERVPVDARILEIVDLSRLELETSLAPDDVAALRVGSGARLTVEGLTGEIGAKVARISPSAQAGSRSVPVYLAIEPNAALRQGLFARGRIEVDQQRVLALPVSAVRTDRAQPYVLALEGDRVAARPVALGRRGEAGGVEQVEITQGASDGMRVLAGTAGQVGEGMAWRMAATPVPMPKTATQASSASAAR